MMRVIVVFVETLLLGTSLFTQSVYANLGSPWPMIHGDSKLTGQSRFDTSKIKGRVKWRLETESGVETSPVIAADGTIYIADHTCNLYAISPQGKEKWRFGAGEPVSSIEWGGKSCFQASPSIGPDGTIYIAPMSGFLFAVNPDGGEKWRYPVFNFKNNWSSPAVGPDGTIYVGSESYPPSETEKPQEKSAYIYALNPDGTLKWSYDTGGNWSTSTAGIADNGTVYMSGNDCKKLNCVNVLFAFDGQTGTLKWTFNHGGVMESSASLGADGTIYFGVKGKDNPRQGAKFFAVTPEGKEKWSFAAPCGNSIIPGIAKDGSIYWGDWDGAFYAISPEGTIIWKVNTPKTFETLSSSPAIGLDGTIYFGSLANYFYAYSPSGEEKWKYYTGQSGINSSPAIGSDGTIYVGLIAGGLIAFGEGEPPVENEKAKLVPTRGYLPPAVFLLALITVSLAIYFKRRGLSGWRWLMIVIPAIILGCLLFKLAYNIKKNTNQEQTNKISDLTTLDEMFEYGEDFDKTCPEKIILENGKNYKAVLGNKIWDVKNMRQIDWISEKCPNTTWPKR